MSVATATEVAYRFDGNLYPATEVGKQVTCLRLSTTRSQLRLTVIRSR